MSRLSDLHNVISELRLFRQAMEMELDAVHVKELWGDTPDTSRIILQLMLPTEVVRTPICNEKLSIALKELQSLLRIPFIKFIGVSGSVAAGTAREDDDIDLFIVASDHTSWIVRAIIKLLLGKKVVWYGQKDQKDRFCVNLIVERRAMRMPNLDIFTLHELLYLIEVGGSLTKRDLFSANQGLLGEYHSKVYQGSGSPTVLPSFSLLALPINILAFLLQLIYMTVLGHKPEPGRLIKSFTAGRIEFYPAQFRVERLKEHQERRSGKVKNDRMLQ